MITNKMRQRGHAYIDHVFEDLFPSVGMNKRVEQVILAHNILDSILDNKVALCDAGTGIGKTYSYLVAGIVAQHCMERSGLRVQPIVISTSSIALQKAIVEEYLPLLSKLLMEDHFLSEPLRAAVRKGRNHYVCERRLLERMQKLSGSKKNARAMSALNSLRTHLDMDDVPHLPEYDQRQICVPRVFCSCDRSTCMYRDFMDTCDSNYYQLHICNHNLLMADAVLRFKGKSSILPDATMVIVDEAHKLPGVARETFGQSLTHKDVKALVEALLKEGFLLAAERLDEASERLLKMFAEGAVALGIHAYQDALEDVLGCLMAVRYTIFPMLTRSTALMLDELMRKVKLFLSEERDLILTAEECDNGTVELRATLSDLQTMMQAVLWNQNKPMVLTSGTLAVGKSFKRYKEAVGLKFDARVTETVVPSPFCYEEHCLLYVPKECPDLHGSNYFEELAQQIKDLVDASNGHALVLFTSYSSMRAVRGALADSLPYPVFTMAKNSSQVLEQFKAAPSAVLLATGAAWEGIDFPGDMVSMLIIPRLPFAFPDGVMERERDRYSSLRAYISAVIVPDMQIKLRQGFGRAIRREDDTCVVAILDERATRGGRYYTAMLDALPDMHMTGRLEDVTRFYRKQKDSAYFERDVI